MMNNFKKILLTSCFTSFSFLSSQGNPQWKKFCLENKGIPLKSLQYFNVCLPDLSEKEGWMDLVEEAIDFQEKNLDSQEEITHREKSNLFFQEKLRQHSCIFQDIPSSFLDTPEKKKDFLKKAQEGVFLKLLGALWANDAIMKNFSFLCITFQKEKSSKDTDSSSGDESSRSQKKPTYETSLHCVHEVFKKTLSEKEYSFLLTILLFPEGTPESGLIPLLNIDLGSIFNYDNRYRSFFDKSLEELNYNNEKDLQNFVKKLKVRSLLEDFFYEEFFSYNENQHFISVNKNSLEVDNFRYINGKIQNFLIDYQKHNDFLLTEDNDFLSTHLLKAEIKKIILNSSMAIKDKNMKYFYFFTTLVAIVHHLNEQEFLDFKDLFLKNTEKDDYLCSTIFQQQALKRIEKFTENTDVKIDPHKLINNMREIIFTQKEHRRKKLKLLLREDLNFDLEKEKLKEKKRKHHYNFVTLFKGDFPKEDMFINLYNPENTKLSLGDIMILLKEDVEHLDKEILFLKNHDKSIKDNYSKEKKQQYLTKIQTENFLQDSIIFHYKTYEDLNFENFKKNIFLYKEDRKGFILSHKKSPLQEPITRYYDIDQLFFGLCFYIHNHSYGRKTFVVKTIEQLLSEK